MTNFNLHRYLLEAIKQLRERGSWTGRTHVVKTLALVHLVSKTPFVFVLYKHGPYSFEVDAELDQMRSYGAVETDHIGKYGPRLRPGPGESFLARVQLPEEVRSEIVRAAEFVGTRTVTGLEAVVTAAWIAKTEQLDDSDAVATKLVKLKPHISQPDAQSASSEALKYLRGSRFIDA